MPSPLSLFALFSAAAAKLSPNSTNTFSTTAIHKVDNPPYLTHPHPMILPGMHQAVVPFNFDHTVNNSTSNNSALPKIPSLDVSTLNTQANTSVAVRSTPVNQNTATQSTTGDTNFDTKSTQLNTLINQYTSARNILFDGYAQFQNNSAIAQYNVREICLSLLATAEYAQKCANYFEEITTDETLTAEQINTLQKSFDAFKAQCKKDCIAYIVPRQREVFYPDQLYPPANINDIVKILHLLQYVINGYAKMITSETGIYSTNVIIDYTGNGGTTVETGVIRFDINMFQDLIQFLHMFSHESGHLETMIFDQESTRTVPAPKLSYAIPSILAKQLPNQENEAEADTNAAIVCALYDVPLSHPYTDFQSQNPLSPSQVGQDVHPQGIERAAIMQEAVSTLSYHFGNNPFGSNNIWQKFAQKIRNISGINFKEDIPTLAELLDIYNRSPNDKARQIQTLKEEYPNLFTKTTRGDYPPAPLVAIGIDKQLAASTNPSIPFQQIRRGTPTESIEAFQRQWALANGALPFPAWDTPPPSPQVAGLRAASKRTVASQTSAQNNPVMPVPAIVSSRSIPAGVSPRVYDAPHTTPSLASASTSSDPVNIPHATPITTRPAVIKKQLVSYGLHNSSSTVAQSITDSNTEKLEKTTRRMGML